MDHRPASPQPLPAWLLVIPILLLSCGLAVATVYYQHPDSTLCRGLLGAGFPLPFVCDASGESPLSSVGRIDWADLDSINPLGSLIDILFYALILRLGWALWRRELFRSVGKPR